MCPPALSRLSVKFPDGRIRLYCKGADTVIYERLSPNSKHKESTQAALDVSLQGRILICTVCISLLYSLHSSHTIRSYLCWFCERKDSLYFVFQDFASATLRTLCLCYKDISADEYAAWSRQHTDAQLEEVNREAALDQVYEQIEKNLMVSFF